MSLFVQASGKKGAMNRVLKDAVQATLDDVGDQLSADQVDGLRAMESAAHSLIYRTPAGMQVDVQLALSPAPFGGVSYSVAIESSRPPSPPTARRR